MWQNIFEPPANEVNNDKVLAQFVTQVHRVYRAVNEMGGEVAARHDLFVGELDVVSLLGGGGCLRMGDVAKRLSISPSNAMRIFKQLEENGLVTRGRAENSDREVIARLSERGEMLYQRCCPQMVSEARSMFNGVLSTQEQATLLGLLGKLNGIHI